MKQQAIPIYCELIDVKPVRSTKTFKVTFETQEVEEEARQVLTGLLWSYGWCMFSPVKLDEMEVPEYEPLEKDDVTPQERQRKLMYVWFKQEQKRGYKAGYSDFYRSRMDQLNAIIKSKLE